MWAFLVSAAIVVAAVVIYRTAKRRPPDTESYVCDVCGEHECICRKEEKGAG